MEINICNTIFINTFFLYTCVGDSDHIDISTNSYDNVLATTQKTISVNRKSKQLIIFDMLPVLEQNDNGNININLFVVRSTVNKLLVCGNGRLCALIQAPNYESALNNELSRFFSNILFFRRQYIQIFDSVNEHHKIIVLNGKGITIDTVIRKLLAVLKLPTSLEQFQQLVSNTTQIYNLKVPITTPVTLPKRTTRNWQISGSWNDVVGTA